MKFRASFDDVTRYTPSLFTCREFDLLMHREQRRRKKSGKAQTWKVRLMVDTEGPMEVAS